MRPSKLYHLSKKAGKFTPYLPFLMLHRETSLQTAVQQATHMPCGLGGGGLMLVNIKVLCGVSPQKKFKKNTETAVVSCRIEIPEWRDFCTENFECLMIGAQKLRATWSCLRRSKFNYSCSNTRIR